MPMIFTADSVRDQLREVNKDYYGRNTWNQAFGQVDHRKQVGEESLLSSYNDEMVNAYLTAMNNKQSIYGSNLGQGYKQLASEEANLAMQSAFDSYRSNYLSQKSALEENASKAIGQYNSLLNTQSENHAAYANYAFSYLAYLYEKNRDAFTNPALGRYATYEDGEITGVKSIDELQQGMFNADGSLTDVGLDYFNMIQNYGVSGAMGQYTFTNYLMEKDPKLLQWLNSADSYSSGKTNLDTFNEVAGTNNEEYKFNFANMTNEQRRAYYDKYSGVNTEMTRKYEAGEYDLEYQKAELENLVSYAKSLGIYNEIEEKIKQANKNMSRYEEKYEDDEEWAVSGAINDYQDLYNSIVEKSAQSDYAFTDTQRTVNREANYDLVDQEITSLYDSKDLTKDQFMSKARSILKDYGTFSIDDSNESVDFDSKGATAPTFTLTYETSNAGSEDISLSYDTEKEITANTEKFVAAKEWNSRSTAGGGRIGSREKIDVAVGRIGTVPVIRYNGKYYRLSNVNDTADNRAFMLYLSSFEK